MTRLKKKPVRAGGYIGPHSWALSDWPAGVYPGSYAKAKYLVRVHKDELLLRGALARDGRTLVVIGAGYDRWLRSLTSTVMDFEANVSNPHQQEHRINGS